MRRITAFCAAMLLSTGTRLAAQSALTEEPDLVLESLASESESEALSEALAELAAHPLPLREASAADIAELPFLPAHTADAIVRLKQEHGLGSWYAIDTLPGVTPGIRASLRRFTTLDVPVERRLSAMYQGRFRQEDASRYGYASGAYPGSRAMLQHRVRATYAPLGGAALIVEKDAGENVMTDHVSGYVELHDIGPFAHVIAGDYTVAAGQGLLLWKPFALARGSDVLACTRRQSESLHPYASSTEGGFLRGAAVTVGAGAFALHLFASGNQIDATVDSSGTAGSFDYGGLHRTETEREKRGTVTERLAGTRATWQYTNGGVSLQTGATGMAAGYSVPSSPRVPFSFEGRSAWGASVDAYCSGPGWALFGETALSHTGSLAVVGGASAALSASVSAAVVLRSYPPAFISIHGNAFGERGTPSNEDGAYLGVRLAPVQQLQIDGFADLFRFPNRTYRDDLPVSGQEYRIRFQWEPSRRILLQARWNAERKDKTVSCDDERGREITPITARHTAALRAELQYRPTPRVRVRMRVERSWISYDAYRAPEQGTLLFADIRAAVFRWLRISARMASYRTGSFDSRLYSYENDLRGVMSNAALYDTGIRAYMLLEIQASARIQLAVKYGVTVRDGASELGEGADSIAGDRVGMVGAQWSVRY